MNGQTKQPRKDSTNARALSTRILHLENNIRQVCTYASMRGQPRPVSNKTKMVKRRVQVDAISGDLTQGGLSAALSGLLGDWSVNYIECWATSSNLSSKFPKGTWNLKQNNILLRSGVNSALEDIVVSDYGSASSIPGVRFTVPKGRACFLNMDTAGTTVLVASTDATFYVVSVNQLVMS